MTRHGRPDRPDRWCRCDRPVAALLVPLLALLLGTLLAAAVPARAATAPGAPTVRNLRLQVTVAPQTVTVGDRVHAVLTLIAPAAAVTGPPRFPTWKGRWGDAEVLSTGPVERTPAADGRATWRQEVTLALFRTGEIKLPRLAVQVPTAAGTATARTGAPMALTVDSVLPAGADPKTLDPTPPAPIRRLPAGAPFWWTLAGAAALAGALVWLGAARRRSPRAAGAVATRPPFEELSVRLDRLLADPPSCLEEAHVALSHALRSYLGRRLGFPAAESTTTEVRRRLGRLGLPDTVSEPTVLVLQRCDAIKFARCPTDAAQLRGNVDLTRRLAGALEAHLAPADAALEAA